MKVQSIQETCFEEWTMIAEDRLAISASKRGGSKASNSKEGCILQPETQIRPIASPRVPCCHRESPAILIGPSPFKVGEAAQGVNGEREREGDERVAANNFKIAAVHQ